MVGWHHQFKGHELGQPPEDGKGQEGLGCCSLWGCKESDMTEQPNNNKVHNRYLFDGLLLWSECHFLSLLIDYAKGYDCVDHNKLWKFLKRWEYQTKKKKKDGNTRPCDLPPEKSVCRSVSNS